MFAALFASAAVATAAMPPMDPTAVKAIEAVAYDYVDGQLRATPPGWRGRCTRTSPSAR